MKDTDKANEDVQFNVDVPIKRPTELLHHIDDILEGKYPSTYEVPGIDRARGLVHRPWGDDEGGKKESIHFRVVNDMGKPDYLAVPLEENHSCDNNHSVELGTTKDAGDVTWKIGPGRRGGTVKTISR